MARTTTSLTGLFAFLLKPATDALYAETGKRISTAGWGRIGRNLLAKGLRLAAELVSPEPEPVPEVAPEPAAVVAPVSEVPAGVTYVTPDIDLPELVDLRAPKVQRTDEPRIYGATAKQWEAMGVTLEPTQAAPKPAPARKPAKAPSKPATPRKAKPAALPLPTKRKGKEAATVKAEPLTVAQVAERLKTQPRAVRKWIEAGRLKGTKGAKGWTVQPDELARFLETLPGGKGKPTTASK